MSSLSYSVLMLAVAGLASGATFHTSSASAGGGLGNRGGTAISTSTRFNNRPAVTTSFTSGTGQTFTSTGTGTGFGSLGTRGGFRPLRVPQVPSFNFRPITFPQFSAPQFRPQPQFVSNSIGTRFGGNRLGGSASSFSSTSNTGINGIDTNAFFNRLRNQIASSFAGNLAV